MQIDVTIYEWFPLRIDRTWLELEWNSPVLLNIILAYQNWLLAESRSGSLIRVGKIFNLYHIIYCDKCKLLKAWQAWQEIKLERKKMNIRNYIYVKFVQDKNIWFVSNECRSDTFHIICTIFHSAIKYNNIIII